MSDKLEGESRRRALAALRERGWAEAADRDAIHKTFKFRNFVEAWGWMSAAALTAEKANHHPEWRNVYRVVEVTLTSHDVRGLTRRDIALADAMDRLAGDRGPPAGGS